MRNQTAAIGRGDAIVQGRGKSTGSDSYQSFQIRLKKLGSAQQDQLTNDLDEDACTPSRSA